MDKFVSKKGQVGLFVLILSGLILIEHQSAYLLNIHLLLIF